MSTVIEIVERDHVIGKGSPSRLTEVFSVQGSELSQQSQHGQAIANLDFASEKPFYASASDGVGLDGILITHTRNRAMPWPTVFAIYGEPPARLTFAFDIPVFHWAPWLASKGYAVLCTNYRGSTSHGADFVAHNRGGVGTKDFDDIVSMVNAEIQRGTVDPNRVAIIGYSQGGFLSYLAVTRPDFHFCAAICGGGIRDWNMLTMPSSLPIFQCELTPGGAPWVASKPGDTATRHASAIWHMKNVDTPILMLHGEVNVRIPLSQAIAFHRACIYHKVDCQLVVFPREPHVITERWHRIHMLRRIEEFCALHVTRVEILSGQQTATSRELSKSSTILSVGLASGPAIWDIYVLRQYQSLWQCAISVIMTLCTLPSLTRCLSRRTCTTFPTEWRRTSLPHQNLPNKFSGMIEKMVYFKKAPLPFWKS